MKFGFLSAALVGSFMAASASAALATPIGQVETFSTSTGAQPSNVGVITLTQVSTTSVLIDLELIATSSSTGYGIINSGNKSPFAFQLNVSGGLAITHWDTPAGGVAPNGTFTLDTSGGPGTPFGSFNTALDYSGGNGTGAGYFGDLKFTLSRSTGLDLSNFVSNGSAYFVADLTDGAAGNTASQAWNTFTTTTSVPEPLTISLFGAGLAGAAALRRRKKAPKA